MEQNKQKQIVNTRIYLITTYLKVTQFIISVKTAFSQIRDDFEPSLNSVQCHPERAREPWGDFEQPLFPYIRWLTSRQCQNVI